jgi:hypothetical protein
MNRSSVANAAALAGLHCGDVALLLGGMAAVRITVSVGPRAVPVEQLADPRLAAALRSAGQDVARRLEAILCPVHLESASNVRIHFDQRGGADLQYDSCCAKLGERIRAAFG